MTNKYAFFHWMTGLLDGEGSFVIYTRRTEKARWASTSLSVTLVRADRPLLEACQREIGGTLHNRPSRGNNWSSTTVWSVRSDKDCQRLVEILDSYPLRSRKAAEYALWRQAVMLRKQFKHGSRYARQHNEPLLAQIEALKAALNLSRQKKE